MLPQAVPTPANLARQLTAGNVRLCTQVTVSRLRIKELRRVHTLVDGEIANYTRPLREGVSLEQSLGGAEQR